MKRFLLLALTAGLLSPIVAKGESIPGISDFDLSFEKPIKMLFSCPRKIVSTVENGRRETESVPIYPECWVEIHKDHLNVMNRQTIKRSDITRFWVDGGVDVDNGKCCYQKWNFSYRDSNKNLKNFKFIRKTNMATGHIAFGRDDKKLISNPRFDSKIGRGIGHEVPNYFFNAWLAQ